MKKRVRATGPLIPDRRAVLYARVSSKDQEREGFSIDAQVKLLREYALTAGFEVARDFVDVETAKESGRTAFGEMLAYLRKKPGIRTLLVEKTDRLYRNLKDWVTIDELELDIHFVKENVILSRDSRSSEKFMHGIKVLMAKNYIDNLSEETRKGMLEKAEQGIWPTVAPLGYKNVMGPHGKRIIDIDPDSAPGVVRLFEWYATGLYSLKEAGARAVDLGLVYRKSGKPLGVSTVHKMLRSRIYTGEFDWLDKRYQGTHDPLVSVELWERVQSILEGRRTTKVGGFERDFVFNGLISCGYCGCSLVADIKKEKYIYYRCSHYIRKCPEPYVREEVLIEQFSKLLDKLKFDEEVLAWIRLALKESHADQERERKDAITRLMSERETLTNRITRGYVDASDGRIESEIFEHLANQWRDRIRRVDQQIGLYREADFDYYDEGLTLLHIANSAKKRFLSECRATKRHVAATLLSNCSWKQRTLTAEFRKPFDIIAENAPRLTPRSLTDASASGGHSEWLPGPDSNRRPSD